jgi:hypothetical protein
MQVREWNQVICIEMILSGFLDREQEMWWLCTSKTLGWKEEEEKDRCQIQMTEPPIETLFNDLPKHCVSCISRDTQGVEVWLAIVA